MPNPFVVGAYVSEEYFCNRSKETQFPEDCFCVGKNAVLPSESGEGKGHLKKHVFHDFPKMVKAMYVWEEML